MLAKWKLELIAFLSSLSMISVGFSSWSISYAVPAIQTTEGKVQTDYVLKTDEYVSVAVTPPTYIEAGYITATQSGIYALSNVGTLELVFTVDNEKCNGLNGETSALKQSGDTYLDITCTITLKNNATTFFSQNSFSVTDYNSNLSFGFTLTNLPDTYTLSITNYPYTQLTEDGQISITFEITSTNQANVYDLLNGNSFVFESKAQGHK